jgi:hypothetical protein
MSIMLNQWTFYIFLVLLNQKYLNHIYILGDSYACIVWSVFLHGFLSYEGHAGKIYMYIICSFDDQWRHCYVMYF